MKKLLQPALQAFLYSATILYNNNVSKIIIYIFQIIAGGGTTCYYRSESYVPSLAILYQTKNSGNSPVTLHSPVTSLTDSPTVGFD